MATRIAQVIDPREETTTLSILDMDGIGMWDLAGDVRHCRYSDIVMAVMAYTVMVRIIRACIGMTCIAMAYIGMAYAVTA